MSHMTGTTYSLLGKGLKLSSAEDVASFITEIQSMPRLETLVLSGNTFGVEAAKALAACLAKQDHLQVVDMSDCFTGRMKTEIPPALSALCDAFVHKPHLTSLNCSDNALGPHGAEAICGFLSKATSLKKLYLNNNGLGPLGGERIANALTQMAKHADVAAAKLPEEVERDGPSRTTKDEEKAVSEDAERPSVVVGLETLVIGRNRLENEAASAFAKTLIAHRRTLTELSLPQNGIRPAGIVALSKALAQCAHLTMLDLQDNTFTLEGCEAFATALPSWQRLRVLNLNDAYLTSRGAHLVLTALLDHPLAALEVIMLQYNGIKEEQVSLLTTAVFQLKQLKSLHLNGNAFDPESAYAEKLREALERCNKEDILDSLSDMECDDEDEDEAFASLDDADELDTRSVSHDGKEALRSEEENGAERPLADSEERKALFDDLVAQMASTHVSSSSKNEDDA